MSQTTASVHSAYPRELKEAESDALRARRGAGAGTEELTRPAIGLALSGGGIRSATFCLGVLQGIARHGLLGKIDYLSTVSGGGYCGSFLGRLFTRQVEDRPAQPPPPGPDGSPPPGDPVLTAKEARRNVAAVRDVLTNSSSGPMRWLRESGRYLAPAGSGDARVAAAVVLRNWIALQLLLAVFVFMAFLAGGALREALWTESWWEPIETALIKSADRSLWWSPLLLVPAAVVVAAALPLGWAYWLTQRGRLRATLAPVAATILGLVAGIVVARKDLWALVGADFEPTLAWQTAGWIAATAAALTLVFWGAAVATGPANDPTRARNRLSRALGPAVFAVFVTLAAAVVDSLGQTLYAMLASAKSGGVVFSGIVAGLVPALAVVRTLVTRNGGTDAAAESRGRLVQGALISVAALVIALVTLVAISVAAHAVLWNGAVPEGFPAASFLGENVDPDAGTAPSPHSAAVWIALGAATTLSLLLSRTFPFLNLSSHQQLYGARLTRAYLGASNPARTGADAEPAAKRITEPIAGDDMPFHEYRPDLAGGPLHIVNVTVNETVDGRSQLEQRDRKGLPLAVGPLGLSVGVRHHALWNGAPDAQRKAREIVPVSADGFPVFTGPTPTTRPKCEELQAGQWVSISGAAFSTGVGARTSLPLSLLTGWANVRLGYWWDSGVSPRWRRDAEAPRLSERVLRGVTGCFPVQIRLLEELLARFHGVARRTWYLTDGGHFENTGCYELLRRRVPLVVCCDCGADPDYEFDDLSTLVRMARIDFGAEVRFDSPASPGPVGPLQSLRRMPAAKGDGAGADRFVGSAYSDAHATVARVYYDGAREPGTTILFLKPTLTGDEPLDVIEYHRSNPAFPQEPTTDQFFDEAQWESYRRLGEHVADEVLARILADGEWARRLGVAAVGTPSA